jgi:hypothetical protein
VKNEEYKIKESYITGHRLRITHFGLPKRMKTHKVLTFGKRLIQFLYVSLGSLPELDGRRVMSDKVKGDG